MVWDLFPSPSTLFHGGCHGTRRRSGWKDETAQGKSQRRDRGRQRQFRSAAQGEDSERHRQSARSDGPSIEEPEVNAELRTQNAERNSENSPGAILRISVLRSEFCVLRLPYALP